MFKALMLKKFKEEGLSSSQAKKWYYSYQSFYIAKFIADIIADYRSKIIISSIFGIYFCIWALIFGNDEETIKANICTFIGIIFLVFDFYTIHSFHKFNKMNESEKEKQIEKNTKKRDAIAEKIQNIWLLDNRVISRKMWKKIKKISPESYKKLRSGELTCRCYLTTMYMLDILQDKDLKLMWILNTNYGKNYKYGHAVIRKGNYIYCPNIRRTYNAKKYFESFETKVFEEMTLSQYKTTKSPKDITIWFDDLKQVIPNRFIADNFDLFAIFCKENGGSISPEDEQD